jgi:hypothetical protein
LSDNQHAASSPHNGQWIPSIPSSGSGLESFAFAAECSAWESVDRRTCWSECETDDLDARS